MKKQTGFKIDEDLSEAINRRCKKNRISMSGLIRMIMGRELEPELIEIAAERAMAEK